MLGVGHNREEKAWTKMLIRTTRDVLIAKALAHAKVARMNRRAGRVSDAGVTASISPFTAWFVRFAKASGTLSPSPSDSNIEPGLC